MRQLARIPALLIVTALGACSHGAPALPGPELEPRITQYQREILGALTGETEIRPGVKLANRFAIENKREARTYIAAALTRMGLTAQRQPYEACGAERRQNERHCNGDIGQGGAKAVSGDELAQAVEFLGELPIEVAIRTLDSPQERERKQGATIAIRIGQRRCEHADRHAGPEAKIVLLFLAR